MLIEKYFQAHIKLFQKLFKSATTIISNHNNNMKMGNKSIGIGENKTPPIKCQSSQQWLRRAKWKPKQA